MGFILMKRKNIQFSDAKILLEEIYISTEKKSQKWSKNECAS